MEIAIVAAHNLKALADLGGLSATVSQPTKCLEETPSGLLPMRVRSSSVSGYKRCRLVARFLSRSTENGCSLPSQNFNSTGGGNRCGMANLPLVCLLPLGRDPRENSGVIQFEGELLGSFLSRRHCVVQLAGREPLRGSPDAGLWCALSVRDCGSKNGTFVNGKRLATGDTSPSVLFDPSSGTSWKQPLLTIEFGPGSKLGAEESLSSDQLLLRFHVFARCLCEGEHIQRIQQFLCCLPTAMDYLPTPPFVSSPCSLAESANTEAKGEGEASSMGSPAVAPLKDNGDVNTRAVGSAERASNTDKPVVNIHCSPSGTSGKVTRSQSPIVIKRRRVGGGSLASSQRARFDGNSAACSGEGGRSRGMKGGGERALPSRTPSHGEAPDALKRDSVKREPTRTSLEGWDDIFLSADVNEQDVVLPRSGTARSGQLVPDNGSCGIADFFFPFELPGLTAVKKGIKRKRAAGR
ncbi:hypothetical protein, conserved [Trypanosoma brucei brucei TREU927]|uniref:FHA domain-containing protein n=1 Tax=Trypanosoma brucei brucei (strain 927/4 GUTat10.1) TaxID=185431 RepID=Q385C1_TRYB2|nr:hypothetical protein, conserved [Trypanosoma brucei brucei TREU927]EAN79610.1 hypothetical protein, conserved [Trypanosoma brucei brucei TREU927]